MGLLNAKENVISLQLLYFPIKRYGQRHSRQSSNNVLEFNEFC